ncbi:Calcium/calmodulin-dependent protein kinase type 1 [Gracilariopsis chorda]|uniref:Calcium/calmodulin-dependent protein kinase type 1 n=1 Tax=Gracilariopsis chorda TaxID=448386 RepID=A0A2V3J395_9FLOR|nr:Calcium/calmodulin-dependent protein kinase type 1 [Gracilariopsis chorda]|eukprot:PXF48854.1 Calcium/calmodulin-dependent protein kinase type 1 [Gracilariopsis chorda]
MSALPSDFGLGIERVTSEHFSRVGSTNVPRNDSLASAAAPPAAAQFGLRFTFQSLQSYGHTEKSSTSLADDANVNANGFVGGVYANYLSPVFDRNTWSATQLLLPSRVEEAAGPALYRRGSIDDFWKLGTRLGMGACSEVRLGESINDSSVRAAIKIVSKGAPDLFCPQSGDCREVLAFRAMQSHSSLVQCLGIYEDERFIYIVMELLTGGQMLPRLTDRERYYPRYCENDIVTVARSLVRALAHLHLHGIAHRDVKPENILYVSESKDPTVKLTDFGIAHTNAHNVNATDMVGTPLYIAPEVLLRQPYGCAADMWSFGVIVHTLLVGFPPFDDDDLVNLINKVKYDDSGLKAPEWSLVSEGARDFVRHLLVRDVPQRLTAQQALAHPWLTTPRPPPFPAPPIPAHSRQSRNPLPRQSTHACRQQGIVPLAAAQNNLEHFLRRNIWKRRESERKSQPEPKLSMLVSLSEKTLKVSDSANDLDIPEQSILSDALAASISPPRTPKERQPRHSPLAVNDAVAGSSDIADSPMLTPQPTIGTQSASPASGRLPRSHRFDISDVPLLKHQDVDTEHQKEQERLRQRRLRIQAQLSRRKRLKERKSLNGSENLASEPSEPISSRTASSQPEDLDERADSLFTDPKFSDDSLSMSLEETFPSRRVADAQEDVDRIHKQRADNEHKSRGNLLGRRTKHFGNGKHTPKSEKTKHSRVKGVRVLRRQRHAVASASSN